MSGLACSADEEFKREPCRCSSCIACCMAVITLVGPCHDSTLSRACRHYRKADRGACGYHGSDWRMLDLLHTPQLDKWRRIPLARIFQHKWRDHIQMCQGISR